MLIVLLLLVVVLLFVAVITFKGLLLVGTSRNPFFSMKLDEMGGFVGIVDE